jgi:hypothetical protein
MADAVAIEPVSASPFPANREKNREFYNFRATWQLRALGSPMILGLLKLNSLFDGIGNFPQGTGKSQPDAGIVLRY